MKAFKILSNVGCRAWVTCSFLERCVARLGTLASDCTAAVLGLTCMIETVLGRRVDGRLEAYAGCRSSCPLRHRERGLGDRGRRTLANDGFQGQRTGKASQPRVQHRYGLLPAIAVSGRVLDGGAGCLGCMHARGRPAGWRAAAVANARGSVAASAYDTARGLNVGHIYRISWE